MVAEVLQLAQLVDQDGVAEVQVRARRVEACLDAQRLPALQLLGELALDQEFVGPAAEDRELVFDVEGHGVRRAPSLPAWRSRVAPPGGQGSARARP